MRFSSEWGRNKSLVYQLLFGIVLTCVFAAAAWICVGTSASLWCAAMGIALVALFGMFSHVRYREISQLAHEIDEVLHSGRRVDFSNCREGDVAILRNELTKMVAQLVRTTEQLEKEKRALAEAMADISHQIRTPLTAMSLTLPAIERAESADDRKRLARELDSLLERVSWLVTSLLKMAKADAGALSVDKRIVQVERVIARAVAPLEAALDLHGVELEMRCDKDVSFTGDLRWTAEALENIVKNCMEHTPQGGTVYVRASEDALATRIVVEDTGCGIDAEDLPYVFDRFYRGKRDRLSCDAYNVASKFDELDECGEEQDASFAQSPEGFGIGLSLAHALVSAQGATLRASNAAAGGARFEMVFSKMVV